MPDLIYLLAVLACPVSMGLMVLFMMRSGDKTTTANDVAELRAEVERLRTAQSSPAQQPDPPAHRVSDPHAGNTRGQ